MAQSLAFVPPLTPAHMWLPRLAMMLEAELPRAIPAQCWRKAPGPNHPQHLAIQLPQAQGGTPSPPALLAQHNWDPFFLLCGLLKNRLNCRPLFFMLWERKGAREGGNREAYQHPAIPPIPLFS